MVEFQSTSEPELADSRKSDEALPVGAYALSVQLAEPADYNCSPARQTLHGNSKFLDSLSPQGAEAYNNLDIQQILRHSTDLERKSKNSARRQIFDTVSGVPSKLMPSVGFGASTTPCHDDDAEPTPPRGIR